MTFPQVSDLHNGKILTEILTPGISCSKGAGILPRLNCLEDMDRFLSQHESVQFILTSA